jgi:hypothetical protein
MTVKIPAEAQPESLELYAQNPQYLGDVAQLQLLLSGGKVEEARRFAHEVQGRWPKSELVSQFVRVLAPPLARVVSGRPGISREQTQKENDWLRKHAPEHAGSWVVLDGDRLIAAHPRLRTAMEEADHMVGPQRGSVHYVPGPATQR